MSPRQGAFGHTQLRLEHADDRVVDVDGLAHERLDDRLHPAVDGGRIRPVRGRWVRERVVLGDVEHLDCVGCAVLVDGGDTCCFVSLI